MESPTTEVNFRDCQLFPEQFKRCSETACIPIHQICPCDRESQLQCVNGGCVPIWMRCDKNNDCGDNTDELDCQVGFQSGSIPASVVVGLSVGSCLVFLLLIFLILYSRRKSSLKSDAESGEPLKKYIPDELSLKTTSHRKSDVKEAEETKQDLLAKRSSIDSFGEGLLCTSTPKMSARQLDNRQFVFDPLSPIVKTQQNKNNNNNSKADSLYTKVT